MPVSPHGVLLERERELDRLHEAIDRAADGDGAMVVLTGPPGIGKTRLIGAASESARDRGFEVLVARGAELEGEFPFGIARQLLEPSLRTASATRRTELLSGAGELAAGVLGQESAVAGSAADPTFAALHGLYWVVANLASTERALLVIDDAHWSDPESIRWLGYLGRRLDGLPVAVVLGIRPDEPQARAGGVDALLSGPAATVIEPAPLSAQAVGVLAAATFDASPEPAFVAACQRASGGNPFLAKELLTALAETAVAPTSANAERALSTGPETVKRAVLARIARLPEACGGLAVSLAIAGGGIELRTLSELAGLAPDEAAEAADLLSAAEIVAATSPPEFRHPILRASIYEDIAPFKRSRAHARAARVIAADGADPARVAAQLIACEPAGDEWAVERLRDAAHGALARGSPRTAVDLLRRALTEPPIAASLHDVLVELGSAELMSHQPAEASEHLSRALELTDDPLGRAVVSRPLAAALTLSGRPADGVAVLELTIAGLPEQARELRLWIEAEIQATAQVSEEAYRRTRARPLGEIDFDPDEPGGRPLLAALALASIQRGRAEDAARIALEACGNGALLDERGPELFAFYLGTNSLTFAQAPEAAIIELTAGIDAAAARGSAWGVSMCAALRSLPHRQIGAVARTEADARMYLELRERTTIVGLSSALGSLIWALTERGELEQAEAALAAHPEAREAARSSEYLCLAAPRARLRIAQGREREALEDLRFCRHLEEAYGFERPALTSWRSDAALCLAALGEGAEAAELIADELSRARTFGAPRPLGIALRAAALLERGERRLELLREAIEALTASPDRLEHARALADLGRAHRSERRTSEARAALDEGLAMARACGATAVAERAHAELEALGVRRRKIVVGGLESLTPAELRVAELAATGRSNRQIAEALFVTMKTVETHLYRAYQKLDIGSRDDLPAALR